ncbi:MAG: T9SS type A sorting domain-containing protein [Bacteroidales bacterium]|nr:T9SS type A sorting domain-containing protein [Bacteroidales bacterium]
MKKSVILVILALALGTATAQDTVFTLTPKSTYFYNDWYDIDTTVWHIAKGRYRTNPNGVTGKRFCFTLGEEVNVYGIAAAMETFNLETELQHFPDSSTYFLTLASMVDTVADSAYEYWGIYKHEGVGLVLASPRLKVNIKTSPVAYYWDINAYNAVLPPHEKLLIPMYEMFFNEPQPVRDSFYLGMTNHIRIGNMMGDVEFNTWPIFWSVLTATGTGMLKFPETYMYCWHSSNGKEEWVYQNRSSWIYLIFPILEPDSNGYFCEDNPVDTTAVDPGDTNLAVQQNVLWRSTVVLPNPACTEARVVSGVGLERVEAYDAAGTLVATVRAEGSEVRLDVSTWPAGTYLLRLTTPLGSTTKKLVVQRR